MNNKSRLLVTLLLSLFLTACATGGGEVIVDDPKPTQPTSNNNTGTTDTGPKTVFGTPYTLEQLRRLGIEGDPLNYKVVYFAYNSSQVDTRSQVIINAHKRYLQSRNSVRVTLEGHADERGTRDYNLALGERRAQQVSNFLQGSGSSINTISYGEERPVDSSHNDAAWSKNRRVVISY